MNNLTKNIIMAPFNAMYAIAPRRELELLFYLQEGYRLDLDDPKTYNEKLQWIKLYDHNQLMPRCCDKYTVRGYVEEQGCGHTLNRLIWEGFDPAEIPFDDLPGKFVIKVTHGSSFNIICKDKARLDRERAVRDCRRWLKARFLPCYGEWFYGVERPRVIVEDFIESTDDEQLRDYKVFCFNGEPKLIRVDVDRFTAHKHDCFDCEWNLMEGALMGFPPSGRGIEKPVCLDELLDCARKLSAPFLHARVDFYIVDGRVVFGEVTFTNGAGFDRFSSYEFDLLMGSWLKLPID